MRHISLLLLILGTLPVLAQSPASNEIVAFGKARTTVAPDIIVLQLTVEKEDTSEQQAIRLLNTQIDGLSSRLRAIGFLPAHITIQDYAILSDWDSDDQVKEYTARNTLEVTFPADNRMLDLLYKNLQEEPMRDLDIDYEAKLSDSLEQHTRQQLMIRAIEDAKAQAQIIARTLKVTLGPVKQVIKRGDDAGGYALRVETVKGNTNMAMGNIRYTTPFDRYRLTPKELEESITVVYQITR